MLKQFYFKLNIIQTLIICLKMANSCYFSFGGNQEYLDFLQKRFITSTTGGKFLQLSIHDATTSHFDATVTSLTISI